MSRSPDILIAEDDPVIRRAVKAALKSEGYSVRETPDGSETSLTARELRLLLLFAARPGEVISRDELLNMCWGIEYLGTTRTLDQHIFVLRKKLGQDGTRLVSVRSLGYRFLLSDAGRERSPVSPA